MTAELLPVLNHSGAAGVNYVGRVEPGGGPMPLFSSVLLCPGSELNRRHVDFQSPVPFSTVRQDSCSIDASRRDSRGSVLPRLNRFCRARGFTGFVEIATSDDQFRTRLRKTTAPYIARKRPVAS